MADKQKKQDLKSITEPWKPQQPYIKKGWEAAEDLYKSDGPKYFPKSTVANFSPAQLEAQRLALQRGRKGSPLNARAGNYLERMLGGKYLNDKPGGLTGQYFADVLKGDYLHDGDQDGKLYNSVANKVMPSVNSQFLASGRYGSDSHAGRMTEAITDAYAPIAADMYARERGMQQGAMGAGFANYANERGMMGDAMRFAPELAGQDWMDIGAMDAVGAQRQNQGQRELDDAVARWAYDQDLPYNKLAQYMGLIGGNFGSTTTSQQPYTQPGLFSTLFGGGLAAAGTAGKLGWSPFG